MNQRTLQVLWLTTSTQVGSGGWTTGQAVDLAAGDGATTNTWTFANIGRREMKLLSYVVGGCTTGAALTSFIGLLQSSSTGVAGTTWATVTNSTHTATTYGACVPIHFMTNDRYIRLHSYSGCLTSTTVISGVLVEQRAS